MILEDNFEIENAQSVMLDEYSIIVYQLTETKRWEAIVTSIETDKDAIVEGEELDDVIFDVHSKFNIDLTQYLNK